MRLYWPHLGSLRVDGEGRHDEVGPLPDQLPYQPCPLLYTDNDHVWCSLWSSHLLPRVVVPLEAAVVALEADVKAVGEVAGPAQLLQEVHAVAPAAEAGPASWATVHKLRALHPALSLSLLLAGHPEGLVPDVDERPLHNGQHLEMGGYHHTAWLVSENRKIVNEVSTR